MFGFRHDENTRLKRIILKGMPVTRYRQRSREASGGLSATTKHILAWELYTSATVVLISCAGHLGRSWPHKLTRSSVYALRVVCDPRCQNEVNIELIFLNSPPGKRQHDLSVVDVWRFIARQHELCLRVPLRKLVYSSKMTSGVPATHLELGILTFHNDTKLYMKGFPSRKKEMIRF